MPKTQVCIWLFNIRLGSDYIRLEKINVLKQCMAGYRINEQKSMQSFKGVYILCRALVTMFLNILTTQTLTGSQSEKRQFHSFN